MGLLVILCLYECCGCRGRRTGATGTASVPDNGLPVIGPGPVLDWFGIGIVGSVSWLGSQVWGTMCLVYLISENGDCWTLREGESN